MEKNLGLSLFVVLLFTHGQFAAAQQPKKIPRVGVLVSGSPVTHKFRLDTFRQGLREFSYIEGKNIVIEYRYAEGKVDRFPDLVDEIVRIKPDVIFVGSTRFTAAAKQATSTIPIVATAGDLVGDGLVASLARPGGNITGTTSIAPDLSGKRLELLKEAVPSASRVAVLWYPGRDENEVKQIEFVARELRVKVQSLQVRDTNEFQGVFAAMKKGDANALIIVQGSFLVFHRKQLFDLSANNRLPSMCENSVWTDDGCLMSYGPDLTHPYRRAAALVDKVLKGTKPADLPVEQPMKFEFVVNSKTAKQIGVTIPQWPLMKADRVIR